MNKKRRDDGIANADFAFWSRKDKKMLKSAIHLGFMFTLPE